MPQRKYVLTGATGGLGSQVFKYLLQLIPASDIAVSLYNPAGVTTAIRDSGVEVRRGDYGDPASLDAAFAGADKLLLVSYPSIAHDLRVTHHRNAIDAAGRAGVQHVYYTSLAFAEDSNAAVMQAHLDTERYLRESGLTYTILREGIYSESYPLYLGFWTPAEDDDEVLIPYSDGGIAWEKERRGSWPRYVILQEEGKDSLVDAALDQGGYENETRLLSGSRAITLTEVAEKAAVTLNREIKLKIGSENDYVERNLGKHGPRGEEEFLRKWATTYKALQRGELEVVDPLLQQILGRELTPFEQTLEKTLGVHGSVMDQYAK